MYDMKALYQAEQRGRTPSPCGWPIPTAQIIAGGSDVLVQMREGKRAGQELISIQRLDELRGVSLEEDGDPAHRLPHQLFPHHPGPPHPEVHQRSGRGRGPGGRPPDPEHRHHRRQHLQRRHLRRLRLHPPRLGRRGGADGPRGQAPACPSAISTSRPARWTSGRGSSRPPSSFRKKATTAASATTSSTPCAAPWTSPPWGPPSMCG